ncbi:hypothetical protein BU15DRAFT_62935 [Melanogaster broomeanus]|nr:hypothetical protein BU15DRAFT_62935 [Melanogaster broomeanus]
MAPKKRTRRSKDSPTASPNTSTPTASEPRPSQSKAPPIDPSDMPRTRSKKGLAPVSPPGSQTPLNIFIYAISLGAVLLLGWYVYNTVTLLGRLKEEVGWWRLITGGSGMAPSGWGYWTGWGSSRTAEGGGELESRLNDLADALGIPVEDVASAVKPFVPPASLTSLALKETGDSAARRVLLGVAEDARQTVGFDDAPEGGVD